MLVYFAVFVTYGMIIGFFVRPATANILIISLCVLWAMAFGPWAAATLVELYLGNFIGSVLRNNFFKRNESPGFIRNSDFTDDYKRMHSFDEDKRCGRDSENNRLRYRKTDEDEEEEESLDFPYENDDLDRLSDADRKAQAIKELMHAVEQAKKDGTYGQDDDGGDFDEDYNEDRGFIIGDSSDEKPLRNRRKNKNSVDDYSDQYEDEEDKDRVLRNKKK